MLTTRRKCLGAGVCALLLVAGFALWIRTRPVPPDLKRGLAGHWLTAGSNMVGGKLILTNVTAAPGHLGAALRFDGNSSRAQVSNSPAFDIRAGHDFSVACWIKPEKAETSFGVMSLVEKRKVGGITTALGFSLHLEYGRLATQISPAGRFTLTGADLISPSRWVLAWQNRNALATVNRFISTGPDLGDDAFHQVALTVKRSSKTGGKLYVDGECVLTFDPTKVGGSLVNNEPILIGTHPDKTLQCGYQGLLEDVRLYTRCLTPEEVRLAAEE
jgi:hypothetical protein